MGSWAAIAELIDYAEKDQVNLTVHQYSLVSPMGINTV